MTDEGIVVVQTSDDPELVEALQVHAAEVSDMADRGMQAVHERMMNVAPRGVGTQIPGKTVYGALKRLTYINLVSGPKARLPLSSFICRGD